VAQISESPLNAKLRALGTSLWDLGVFTSLQRLLWIAEAVAAPRRQCGRHLTEERKLPCLLKARPERSKRHARNATERGRSRKTARTLRANCAEAKERFQSSGVRGQHCQQSSFDRAYVCFIGWPVAPATLPINIVTHATIEVNLPS
jgi:hypothetical protein